MGEERVLERFKCGGKGTEKKEGKEGKGPQGVTKGTDFKKGGREKRAEGPWNHCWRGVGRRKGRGEGKGKLLNVKRKGKDRKRIYKREKSKYLFLFLFIEEKTKNQYAGLSKDIIQRDKEIKDLRAFFHYYFCEFFLIYFVKHG